MIDLILKKKNLELPHFVQNELLIHVKQSAIVILHYIQSLPSSFSIFELPQNVQNVLLLHIVQSDIV